MYKILILSDENALYATMHNVVLCSVLFRIFDPYRITDFFDIYPRRGCRTVRDKIIGYKKPNFFPNTGRTEMYTREKVKYYNDILDMLYSGRVRGGVSNLYIVLRV